MGNCFIALPPVVNIVYFRFQNIDGAFKVFDQLHPLCIHLIILRNGNSLIILKKTLFLYSGKSFSMIYFFEFSNHKNWKLNLVYKDLLVQYLVDIRRIL